MGARTLSTRVERRMYTSDVRASLWQIDDDQLWHTGGSAERIYALRMLERHGVEAGSRVLDVPCGRGRFDGVFSRHGYVVYGVDNDSDFVYVARHRVPEGRFCIGDMRRIGFADGVFAALVNLYDSFGYFDDATNLNVLKGFARVLAPKGLLFLQTTNTSELLAKRLAGEQVAIASVQGRDMFQIARTQFTDKQRVVKKQIVRARLNLEPGMYPTLADLMRANPQMVTDEIVWTWRAYSTADVESMCKEAGFDISKVYRDQTFQDAEEHDSSILLVARKRE